MDTATLGLAEQVDFGPAWIATKSLATIWLSTKIYLLLTFTLLKCEQVFLSNIWLAKILVAIQAGSSSQSLGRCSMVIRLGDKRGEK